MLLCLILSQMSLSLSSVLLIFFNFVLLFRSYFHHWFIIQLQIFCHSVQFSRSVMSESLWPHELQHTRPPCPSPTPRVHPNPCPSSQWCHRTISSSVVPFSSCPQSFPVSGSFPMSRLFASGGLLISVIVLFVSVCLFLILLGLC